MSSQTKTGIATSVELNSLALSGLYNFAASGPRTLTFDPVSTFEVIGRDATRFEIVKASSISITIGGDASKRELGLEKRYATCPYPDKELFMSMGASEAVTLSRGALSYLDSHDVNDDLYRMYFGLKDMKDKVKENFKLIEGVDSKAMTLTCWDIRGFCTKDAQGYSIKDESTVVVCGGFFTHSPLSTLCRIDDGIVRGGITLRYMATVVMPGVFDATKGCDRAQPGNDYLAGNYEVSTQIPGNLPGADVLTCDRDLYSASLPLSTSAPNVGNENLMFSAWTFVLFLRFIQHFESFTRQN